MGRMTPLRKAAFVSTSCSEVAIGDHSGQGALVPVLRVTLGQRMKEQPVFHLLSLLLFSALRKHRITDGEPRTHQEYIKEASWRVNQQQHKQEGLSIWEYFTERDSNRFPEEWLFSKAKYEEGTVAGQPISPFDMGLQVVLISLGGLGEGSTEKLEAVATCGGHMKVGCRLLHLVVAGHVTLAAFYVQPKLHLGAGTAS
ncbi:hypothetical protein H920_00538 [Fukomys damarensis]|uniref:Uncharacterized protein n=1 Tax=Fukomys damarensis TaxID=885580 RepID=A0A091E5Y8_FUKDA|nr:hypothetical protein H920_00538 [Fukomys damarensis]